MWTQRKMCVFSNLVQGKDYHIKISSVYRLKKIREREKNVDLMLIPVKESQMFSNPEYSLILSLASGLIRLSPSASKLLVLHVK